MRCLESFKRKVSPQTFVRIWLVITALWFLCVYPAMNWFCPQRLVWGDMAVPPGPPLDFGQYYAGALAAKHGLWDALYPIPKAEVYNCPPKFKPKFKTFLFDEKTPREYYYPPLNLRDASDFSPRLLAYCPELESGWRFFYPPPAALLLQPLAYFDFETAGHRVWPTFLMISLFGVAWFSSRIHRLLRGGISYSEGLILGSVICFSFWGRSAVPYGNVATFLSCLITFSLYAFLRGWYTGLGVAMIPLLVLKAIGLTWCPLFVIGKVRWKTLLSMAVLTVIVLGVPLWQGGIEVYRQFFYEVLPKLHVPAGSGLVQWLLQIFGVYPAHFYLLIKLVVLAVLYFGYWKSLRGPSAAQPPAIAAAMAGTMALFCLINFTFWYPYFAWFLFCPFLGWILWEGYEARGRWRLAILGGAVAGFIVVGCERFNEAILLHTLGVGSVKAYQALLFGPCVLFLLPGLILAVAIRRLMLPTQSQTTFPDGIPPYTNSQK